MDYEVIYFIFNIYFTFNSQEWKTRKNIETIQTVVFMKIQLD